jgi:hypothetical protein
MLSLDMFPRSTTGLVISISFGRHSVAREVNSNRECRILPPLQWRTPWDPPAVDADGFGFEVWGILSYTTPDMCGGSSIWTWECVVLLFGEVQSELRAISFLATDKSGAKDAKNWAIP